MPNHFHLLLKTGAGPIAWVMKRLLTGYAMHYNRRHRRNGHLFQNRYKSILCQEDAYLLELVRYIHLNPLRAKLVADMKELGKNRYSGHGVLLGNVVAEWQDTKYVLRLFGEQAICCTAMLPGICAKGDSRRQEAGAHRWWTDSQFRGMVSRKSLAEGWGIAEGG